MLEKVFSRTVLVKNTCRETLTTAQIILKDKDDIDALCPTNISSK